MYIGTYQENSLAVWSCHDYSLLAATTVQFPVHDIAWDPHIAYEFTAVGGGGGRSGVTFWMMEETSGGKEWQLKVCSTKSTRERERERERERSLYSRDIVQKIWLFSIQSLV